MRDWLNRAGRLLVALALALMVVGASTQDRVAQSVQTPGSTPAPQRNPRCAGYARAAVDDYRTTQHLARCLIGADARWRDDYPAHYSWCLANLDRHSELIVGEDLARAKHLFRCGVRRKY